MSWRPDGEDERDGLEEACPGCGGIFHALSGPSHRYVESSPGCWAVFGEVLAREYSDPGYWVAHPTTVDCYAVQHPGKASPQAIGSVSLHLMRLCAMLERGLPPDAAPKVMRLLAKKKRAFRWLELPVDLGPITVLDVRATVSAEEHRAAVKGWAQSLWNAWSKHHFQIRSWLDEYALDPFGGCLSPSDRELQQSAYKLW